MARLAMTLFGDCLIVDSSFRWNEAYGNEAFSTII
jgi:hypothetical protein